MRIQTDFANRTRFKLDGRIIIDPKGFNESDLEFSRNDTYFGIGPVFSNNLTFVKNGADYITFVKNTYGINKDIQIIKEVQNSQTDIWELDFSGFLDLSTYTSENGQVNCKINSGGLEKLLKARESEQVEIDRALSIDGIAITKAIPEITVNLTGKAIQIVSDWASTVTSPNNNCVLSHTSEDGDTGAFSSGIVFPIINNSIGEDQEILYGSNVSQDNQSGGVTYGTEGQMFYADTAISRVLKVNIDFSFVLTTHQSKVTWGALDVFVAKYTGGATFNMGQKVSIFNLPNKESIVAYHNQKVPRITHEGTYNLEIGESLGLIAELRYDLKDTDGFGSDAVITVKLDKIEGTMKVVENSTVAGSTSKAYLYKDLLNQLVKITTNDNNGFISKYLESKLFGVTHGFFIRGFKKYITQYAPSFIAGGPFNFFGLNLGLRPPISVLQPSKLDPYFKPLTTSFKDAIASLDSIEPVGMGIEYRNGKENVVVENIDYFFNQNITIRLGQVSNIKRSVAAEFYYSSLLFGSEKGGEYDEANGLDEFNTQTTYTTCITRLKKIYDKMAKYRKDGTGKELCRRITYKDNPTTDTTYDNDVFLLDLKKGNYGLYEERGSTDYSSVEGIYSPETSNGFYFSAKQSLLRHARMFSGTLELEPTNEIRFASSKYNSKLKINGVGESDSLKNSSLDNKLFTPEWIEFNYVVDTDLIKLVKGKTIFNGTEVVNFYGLVEFINESGSKETGYLWSLKPSGNGDWKILKR